jgi:hypothetical protein
MLRLKIFKQRLAEVPTSLSLGIDCHRREGISCLGKHVHACSRMGARVGLPPGGPGGRSGLISVGLVSEIVSSSGAGFLEAMAGSVLLLAENIT